MRVRSLSKLRSILWTPTPGRAPQGRAPGWVPGAHQSRPEAQGRRGKRAGERALQWGDHWQYESAPQYIKRGISGRKRAGTTPNRTRGQQSKPKPHRPGRLGKRSAAQEFACVAPRSYDDTAAVTWHCSSRGRVLIATAVGLYDGHSLVHQDPCPPPGARPPGLLSSSKPRISLHPVVCCFVECLQSVTSSSKSKSSTASQRR